jgi:diaminopimelate epimerase
MNDVRFTKMQGLGNDFVVVDGPIGIDRDLVERLCDRRRGVGADGVLVVTPGEPVHMDYWNADGSAAELCGNGLRCVARYSFDRGLAGQPVFDVSTPIGIRRVDVGGPLIEVEIGEARVVGHETIDDARYHLIDVGNPHAVTLVEDPASVDVDGIASSIQTHPGFADGVNVEFAAIREGRIVMRVWERGAGETLACGTGMVAGAVVATRTGQLDAPISVEMPGGRGSVDFRGGSAWLTGPAEYSFTGVFQAPLAAES